MKKQKLIDIFLSIVQLKSICYLYFSEVRENIHSKNFFNITLKLINFLEEKNRIMD